MRGEFQNLCAGECRQEWGVGRADNLTPPTGELIEDGQKGETRPEGERCLGFIEEIKPLLVKPSLKDLQKGLTVAYFGVVAVAVASDPRVAHKLQHPFCGIGAEKKAIHLLPLCDWREEL
jgi:hypothetical protein